jgi:hypothetical protein
MINENYHKDEAKLFSILNNLLEDNIEETKFKELLKEMLV